VRFIEFDLLNSIYWWIERGTSTILNNGATSSIFDTRKFSPFQPARSMDTAADGQIVPATPPDLTKILKLVIVPRGESQRTVFERCVSAEKACCFCLYSLLLTCANQFKAVDECCSCCERLVHMASARSEPLPISTILLLGSLIAIFSTSFVVLGWESWLHPNLTRKNA
jgi:hypothetical protein